MKSIPITILLISLATATAPVEAKKAPFTGNWVSKQYTNGKEFFLKIQQTDNNELIGWEGRLPADLEKVSPDLKGSIKGKEADIEIQHRRGYQAHAHLRLQSGKLVWQLMESDNRSSRYFPLASTLQRYNDDAPPVEASQLSAVNNSSDQPIWTILSQAESFETGPSAEGQAPSPYFSAYKALASRDLKPDDISLSTLLKSAKPAARLYAAAILRDVDHDAGREAFKSLQSDNSVVAVKSAAGSCTSTVAEIARSFAETGTYLDFPTLRH